MKVLLIGGGGREHALAWKLKRDDPSLDLIAAPGNPGIAELASCYNVPLGDVALLRDLAASVGADLTVVGPEAPLAAGIVDEFERSGLRIFGPTRAAARLETSKRFAKELMLEAGIPTAGASWHVNPVDAKEATRRLGAPVVIKASGLAAGKGVAVCESHADADLAIDSMLRDRVYGDAGDEVLVEEFMAGEELSVFAITDGENFVTMLPAQDHKRLLDHDQGPNTGGMGAYAPVSVARADLLADVEARIIGPVLREMRARGSAFRGLLYCGLMLTERGPKVVEFNARFGDPETQVLLPLMESPLYDYLYEASEPSGLVDAPEPAFFREFGVTTVVAAPGYPEAPKLGARIELDGVPGDALVFHAGTRRAPDGSLVTSGGRVFAVTCVADSLESAQEHSARAAAQIRFDGRHFRSDIGWRELKRSAGAA